MKRITYWPQLFLGITFNWGIIMAWTAMNNNISFEIIFFIYQPYFGHWDMTRFMELKICQMMKLLVLKSTSIKFKKNIKNLFIFHILLVIFFIILFF